MKSSFKKSSVQGRFPNKARDTTKEEIKPILHKLCRKMRGQHNPDSKTRQERC